MPKIITESDVEEECLKMLERQGYSILYGPDISEGGLMKNENPVKSY